MNLEGLRWRESCEGGRTMTRIALLSALAFLSACSTASSTDLKTSGLYASITGTGDGSGKTTVSTTLQLGQLSTTFVELGGSDVLSASSSATDAVTLKKFSLLGLVSYSGSLTGDEEGKTITVALTRGKEDTSAPNSVLTLPAKFEITGPVAATTFVRGKDAIVVAWDNSGKSDPMTVELSGECIEGVNKTASDNGTLIIAAADIKASKDNETKTCDVQIVVKRSRKGTLDPAYGKGGSTAGIQLRSLSVNSAPQ
jgi:hypothetical protein